MAAALSGLADGTTLTYTGGHLTVIGQAPTAVSTTPTLAGLQVLLANGQYVTGAQLAALLGTTTSSSTTPTTIAADGTLSGLPSTTVAGQPLSAASYVPTTGAAPYLVLYNVGSGAEEGARFTPNVMPGGNLSLLIPQTANGYTVRGFAAATGGNATYESAQFNVTAAPGALPATPTQTADTGATSSAVTMNWTATASDYRVLTRTGVGTAYGSLSDTTTTATSYTFANQAASSLVRAVVIPQNANGSGTPTGQFISFTASAG